MQKINYLDGYLYCSVSAEIFNEEYYSSYDEYFNDYEDDIKASCKEQGYSESETEVVLSYYRIHWGNSSVQWGENT